MNRDPAPRVIVAPQSFKGSADAVAVASAIARGIRHAWPGAHIEEMPLADGGEGTVRALVTATNGGLRRSRVHDPLGREIDAEWGVLGDGLTAVVEMAAASGLPLLELNERDARITSTRGTGELILAAAASGAHRIVIGIGGSATNDGGAGMARAFGYRFLDRSGNDLPEGGAALARLGRIAGADLVVTGEGRVDQQSGFGKLTGAVTAAARRAGVPVVAIAGSLGAGHETLGLDAIGIASEDVPMTQAMREPLPLIERAAEKLLRARPAITH